MCKSARAVWLSNHLWKVHLARPNALLIFNTLQSTVEPLKVKTGVEYLVQQINDCKFWIKILPQAFSAIS